MFVPSHWCLRSFSSGYYTCIGTRIPEGMQQEERDAERGASVPVENTDSLHFINISTAGEDTYIASDQPAPFQGLGIRYNEETP